MKAPLTYLLYASCVPVSGAKNKIICDLQRNSYVQIPDGLFDILTEHRGRAHTEIKAAYDNQYYEVIDGYFEMLVRHEFAFACTDPALFPPLDLGWRSPFAVYNAILDRGEGVTYDLQEALRQLSEMCCKFLQLRHFSPVSAGEIEELFEYLDRIRSATIGIELVLPESAEISVAVARGWLKTYNRLNKISLHGTRRPFAIEEVRSKRFLLTMPDDVNGASHCGVIDPGLFSINIKAFTEARAFNSCLNGKISIDQHGFIRNCPSMARDFGHFPSTSLAEATNHPAFREQWNVTKDEVAVCRDCEFRYICTDCRAYTVNDDAKGKPSKCSYDPYAGVWKTPASVPRSAPASAPA